VVRRNSADSRRIAAALGRRRREIAQRFFDAVALEKRLPAATPPEGLPLAEYLQRDFYVFVDLFQRFLETSDETFRNLLVGELARQLSLTAETSTDELSQVRHRILQAEREGLSALLRPDLTEAQLALLDAAFSEVASILTAPGGKALRILMVGDCLLRDIVAFLIGPCLEDGVSLNITFVSGKDPASLRNELRGMRGRKFDLAFFSPFTYEFSPEYARLLDWRFAASRAALVGNLVGAALESAFSTARLLSDLFDCTVFVHSSAGVPRHDSRLRDLLLNSLTLRHRALGRRLLNEKLGAFVEEQRAAGNDRLFLLDEMELLRRRGERALGRIFHDSGVQRPAAMGKWLAAEYREIIAAQARLLGRKLVICDLDNTLWKGLIGEGAIAHWPDRQRTLKSLRDKGVVLAVSSKNDPKNVRWEGCVLGESDFVSKQIGWDPKTLQVRRILSSLNLQGKDCVFIDDRADERELVKAAEPAIQVLDATAARSWEMLSRWAGLLPPQVEGDRTLLYQQREARQSFLGNQPDVEEEPGALFRKLEIRIRLQEPARADLKRVAELINRTNQFNTCGTRTTTREIEEWNAAPDRRILVIDSADKFGSVGTVAALVAQLRDDRVEIPVFVLSCRVFGYGIETVALNVVKSLARGGSTGERLPVIGHYRQTAYNDPCRDAYARNGFSRRGDAWVFDAQEAIVHPSWLAVEERWRPFNFGEAEARMARIP
jgi:FkbH-like protein